MEQVTIKIPTGWNEVTIAQFQEFLETKNTMGDIRPYKQIIKLLSVLTDVDEALFYKMPMDTIYDIRNAVHFMNEEPKGVFKNIISIDGVEYGFQKNLTELTLGEWIDLEHYTSTDIINNLHYICAILYRPLVTKNEDFFDYEILPYEDINLEKNAKLMKYKANIDDIYGIAGFFLTISEELLAPMMPYLQKQKMTEMEMRMALTTLMRMLKDEEQKKKLMQMLENNDLKSGIGNYLSTLYVEAKYGDMETY